MTKRILSGHDVDTGEFAVELRVLASEMVDGDALVQTVSAEHEASAESEESVTISIEVTPTTDSYFSGGYNIPFDTDG